MIQLSSVQLSSWREHYRKHIYFGPSIHFNRLSNLYTLASCILTCTFIVNRISTSIHHLICSYFHSRRHIYCHPYIHFNISSNLDTVATYILTDTYIVIHISNSTHHLISTLLLLPKFIYPRLNIQPLNNLYKYFNSI